MNILVVDDIHEVFLATLRGAGLRVDYQPELELKGALAQIHRYEGLVIRSKFRVERSFIDRADRLRFIARAGAGMDNIDADYAAGKGIVCLNAPEGNRLAVAEHMTGMLLALLNNFRKSHDEIADGQWLREANRGTQLSGKTVGLLGYGNNGEAMARCLSGFGTQLLAYDKYRKGFGSTQVRESSMDALFEGCDILSLHLPLTPETRGLVNADFLARFRKPIFFLNGARGEIVDIPAIVSGLQSGQVLGAAFDVLPVERFPDLREQAWFADLSSHPRVLLSPHVAGWTTESYYHIARVLADKVTAFCNNHSSP